MYWGQEAYKGKKKQKKKNSKTWAKEVTVKTWAITNRKYILD